MQKDLTKMKPKEVADALKQVSGRRNVFTPVIVDLNGGVSVLNKTYYIKGTVWPPIDDSLVEDVKEALNNDKDLEKYKPFDFSKPNKARFNIQVFGVFAAPFRTASDQKEIILPPNVVPAQTIEDTNKGGGTKK